MGNLISRLRRTGFLFLMGLFLIVYIALGTVYLQQGPKQKDFDKQIAQLNIVLARPLPSVEKLQTEYEKVNEALAPISAVDALARIVNLARESGIDVDPDSGKFNIPPLGLPRQEKVGGGTYQVLSFKSIKVQGDYDKVMAFIAALDSGKTLENMVLENVTRSQTTVDATAEERTRREEFRNLSLAVMDMMADNDLTTIPNPVNFAGGVATNLMGDDPNTLGKVEGFPDVTTTAWEKGYTTGEGTPRGGYVLYKHDKITATDNFTTVSYISIPEAEYYYTYEADGTLRQFDGPDVATATEFPKNEWEERRTEKYFVSSAVSVMMADNDLSAIYYPINFACGVATNLMGDDPNTLGKVEGFPDITTSRKNKGYTGEGVPKVGYVLYKHDKISTANTTQFETVSYIFMPKTKYYYTAEADGTLRQFDGSDVAMAREYVNIETVATLDIDIYTKPSGG